MMFPTRNRWKSLWVCLLAVSSLTACGYTDDGARTNRYNGPATTLDHGPIPAEGYQNQYYTNQYDVLDPDVDNINDSPYLKAEQMRRQ